MPANAPPEEQRLLSRQLLLQLLSEYCGIDTLPLMSVRFGGKPYFPQHPNIHFNLSHCQSAVMAVVSDSRVGCDIEDLFPPDSLTIPHFFFPEKECALILASVDPLLEMTKMWTRKEALVKCRGSIPDDPLEWPSPGDDVNGDVQFRMMTDYQSNRQYVFTIVWEKII